MALTTATTTTTLMTFRVRTPSTTRTVELYGSWDNFSIPYPMRRDIRLGAEHWSGCHSFENIICDGRMYGSASSRRGGLRMGGTYWYYYKLNDDIEFHNSTEPSTTACPLLPGQLVNVLQVPIALSGSHHRSDSVSSTSSEQRTMNPEDRFMNPRPSPAPPTLCRLNTSPNPPQLLHSTTSSPTSSSLRDLSRCASRENLHVPNMHRLPRMASHETFTRPGPMVGKSAGLRQAFRTFRTARSRSPEARYKEIVDWTPAPNAHISTSAPHTPESEIQASSYFDSKPEVARPSRGLLLRSTSDNSIPTMSFLEHRRERSRSTSRGPSSLRGSVVIDDGPCRDVEQSIVQRAALDTLIEVASPPCAVAPPPLEAQAATEKSTGQPMQVDKRLPTLPNTPSSAYPPTASYMHGSFADELAGLSSRFSASTMDTESHIDSMIVADQSRFSAWSLTSADLISPASDGTIEDFIPSPMTEYAACAPSVLATHPSDDAYQSSFASSTFSTAPSTSHGQKKSSEYVRGFQHYQLPECDFNSEITIKRFNVYEREDPVAMTTGTRLDSRSESRSFGNSRDGFAHHSVNMQDLMDELSYLSEAIINH